MKFYGIEGDVWLSDEEMFGLIYEMWVCIVKLLVFIGDKVMGVILFECMMDGEIDGVLMV